MIETTVFICWQVATSLASTYADGKNAKSMKMENKKSHDDDTMDFNKLEKELAMAVEQDQRYWRENDAKFRAVHQKVGSYEEFRDIVLASHIKPLQKGDTLENVTFDVKWNPHADKNKANPPSGNMSEIKKTSNLPKDSQEFTRDWRRYQKSTADQYNFLLEIGGIHLGQIFKTDINLLGDFLVALDSEYQDQDSETVTTILENLSSAQRFTLSVQFLSGKEKKSCESLIRKLEATSDDSTWKDRIEKLKSSYDSNK
ncbi:coiled-coil domain-containing protein 103-like [Ostrea edulis]|uniref:coiled-coil domain-containing protein 103-like n=1 Tax=Ostrea edulis TaxID=37623 RepID=UPI0024AF43AC|nr:coiled-coil domain-containing protein 103-like [Ostrea edulis]